MSGDSAAVDAVNEAAMRLPPPVCTISGGADGRVLHLVLHAVDKFVRSVCTCHGCNSRHRASFACLVCRALQMLSATHLRRSPVPSCAVTRVPACSWSDCLRTLDEVVRHTASKSRSMQALLLSCAPGEPYARVLHGTFPSTPHANDFIVDGPKYTYC